MNTIAMPAISGSTFPRCFGRAGLTVCPASLCAASTSNVELFCSSIRSAKSVENVCIGDGVVGFGSGRMTGASAGRTIGSIGGGISRRGSSIGIGFMIGGSGASGTGSALAKVGAEARIGSSGAVGARLTPPFPPCTFSRRRLSIASLSDTASSFVLKRPSESDAVRSRSSCSNSLGEDGASACSIGDGSNPGSETPNSWALFSPSFGPACCGRAAGSGIGVLVSFATSFANVRMYCDGSLGCVKGEEVRMDITVGSGGAWP